MRFSRKLTILNGMNMIELCNLFYKVGTSRNSNDQEGTGNIIHDH
jgi:hypothetical protein